MTLDPPRVVDQVTVGDAPEGLAVSPTAGYAVPLLTNGAGNVPKNAFFHHDHAIAVLLKSDGKTMRKVGQTEVGTLSEGIAFSPDGRYVYVANWGEQNLVPYQLQGDKLVAVGTRSNCPAIRCRCAAARHNGV
jgi:DNA-binding beta-propeller fold protein YncE